MAEQTTSRRDERRDDRRGGRVSARHRAENHKGGYDKTTLNINSDTPLFQLKQEGARRIDIIPYRVSKGNPYADAGTLHFERTYWAHRGIGVDENSYVCPKKTTGAPCPICEARAKLAKDPDADEDALKDLAPKERQLFNVIDLDDRDRGVQVFDVSYHLFGKRLDKEVKSEPDEYEFFADLREGLSLKLGVEEGTFGGGGYYEVATIGFKARKEQYGDDVLDQVYDLDAMLKVLPYDKLKAIFLQIEDKPADDSGDGDAPPARQQRQRPPADDAGDDAPPPRQQQQRRQAPAQQDADDAPPPRQQRQAPPPADDDWDDQPPAPARPQGQQQGQQQRRQPPPDDGDGQDDGPPPKPRQQQQRQAPPPADDDWDDAPPPAQPAKAKQQQRPPADDAPPPRQQRQRQAPPADDGGDDAPPPKPRQGAKQQAPPPADDGDDWDKDWDDAPPPKQQGNKQRRQADE